MFLFNVDNNCEGFIHILLCHDYQYAWLLSYFVISLDQSQRIIIINPPDGTLA